jgi:hypothetical protein
VRLDESSRRVAPWHASITSELGRLERVGRMTASEQARSGLWLKGGAVFLLLTGGVLVLWFTDKLPFLSKRDGRNSSAGARLEDGAAARQSAGRDALRGGRFDVASEYYRALPESSWEAEDCFLLGLALLERGRMALGQAALEAARRIDPKHPAAIQALDELQGKLALAPGGDRSVQHETASRVELLRSIPAGPALGMLALGLARYAGNRDQEDEFFDRLGVRDRASFRGVNGTTGATLLVARLLLETGRANEARDVLDLLVATPRAPAGSVSSPSLADREAAWLLGRAALQLSQHETADAMLDLAGNFGRTSGALPEPAPYVGSRRCGECHASIFRAQQGASRHAQTLRFEAGLKDIPLPAHPVPDPVISGITHHFSRKGDDKIEVESRVDDRVVRAVVDYAVGSGRHGITMLAKDEQGIERELRISYFGESGTWGETKGVDFAPRDAGDHLGIGIGRKAVHHCLHCHTTWFRSLEKGTTAARGPERIDKGIGCERCHGPGLNHVKAVESGFGELAIALTRQTPSLQRLSSCVECHAADGTIQPSDPEFTRAQGTTFLFSRCFTAAKDRLNCTTCHDPHRNVVTSAAHYEKVCLSCHSPRTAALPRALPAGPAKVDTEGKGRACPVNPAGDCISCHMPKVEDPSRRSRFTDHHIRVHRGDGTTHAVKPAH